MPEWMTIPDLPDDQQERRMHIERYEYAASVLKGKRVLDCACGMGYGTDIMRCAGVLVSGIDKDKEAITLARKRYPDCVYTTADVDAISFKGLDALVAFEFLEHLDRPELIIDRCGRACVSEIIASVPIRPTVHVNHWHRTDFTPDSFRKLIESRYRIVPEQEQIWSDGEPMYLMLHGQKL